MLLATKPNLKLKEGKNNKEKENERIERDPVSETEILIMSIELLQLSENTEIYMCVGVQGVRLPRTNFQLTDCCQS